MLNPTPKAVGAVGFFDTTHVVAEWSAAFLPSSAPGWLSQGIAIAALMALVALTVRLIWAVLPGLLRACLTVHRWVTKLVKEVDRRLRRNLSSRFRTIVKKIETRLSTLDGPARQK